MQEETVTGQYVNDDWQDFEYEMVIVTNGRPADTWGHDSYPIVKEVKMWRIDRDGGSHDTNEEMDEVTKNEILNDWISEQ